MLDGGAGRDALIGGAGADRLLARDGERDAVDCAGARRRGSSDDRATIDTRDEDSWCEHVDGARRLVLHGLTPRGRAVGADRGVLPAPARLLGARVGGQRARGLAGAGAGGAARAASWCGAFARAVAARCRPDRHTHERGDARDARRSSSVKRFGTRGSSPPSHSVITISSPRGLSSMQM